MQQEQGAGGATTMPVITTDELNRSRDRAETSEGQDYRALVETVRQVGEESLRMHRYKYQRNVPSNNNNIEEFDDDDEEEEEELQAVQRGLHDGAGTQW